MKNTLINWADHTHNPWIGCTNISEGCEHCYAAQSLPAKFMGIEWGKGEERRRTKNWEVLLAWDKSVRKRGSRERVFCGSLCDLCDSEVPEAWRMEYFRLIGRLTNLDCLLLTNRPHLTTRYEFPVHVWIGTSVENQKWAGVRIKQLQCCKAGKRFLSVEPLLGPVKLDLHGIDWVIVGGESGSHARPMDISWARDIRDQCQKAGAAFWMKQLGGYPDKRDDLDSIPADLRIRELPFGSGLTKPVHRRTHGREARDLTKKASHRAESARLMRGES